MPSFTAAGLQDKVGSATHVAEPLSRMQEAQDRRKRLKALQEQTPGATQLPLQAQGMEPPRSFSPTGLLFQAQSSDCAFSEGSKVDALGELPHLWRPVQPVP